MGPDPALEHGMSMPSMAEAEARVSHIIDRATYERFLPLIRRTAIRVARGVPAGAAVADLVGFGWVGLMDAYQRVAAGIPDEEFDAYALYRVHGAMLDHLRGLDAATRSLRRASLHVARAIRDLSRELGKHPEEEEISRSMEMDLPGYRALLEKIAEAGLARIELLDLDEVEMGSAHEPTDDAAAKRRLADAVAAAMDTLPPPQVQLFALLYQEHCTHKEIGALLGVGESRVSQLHTEAIHRLRAAVGRD
jgi:RNA polymerase sigma factor for flagellar operon FliA